MWHKKWILLSIILIVVLMAGAGLYRIFKNVMRGETYQVVCELDLPKWVRDLAQNQDAHFEEIMAAVEKEAAAPGVDFFEIRRAGIFIYWILAWPNWLVTIWPIRARALITKRA